MVFKHQFIREKWGVGYTDSGLIRFMINEGYLVLDQGQVASFPSHKNTCPVTTRVRLSFAQAALIKKVKSSHSPLNLISTKYPRSLQPRLHL
jgi:hypothetical protein